MKTFRLLICSLAAIVGVACPVRAQGQAPERFDDYVVAAMREWQVPGLAVAVVKDDQVVFARGYGVRELGKAGAVDADTVFAVASNTKAFTATAVGMLVQEGKIGWDDRVVEHVPGFRLYDPYVTGEITVRDLLCHRAGFATWAGDLAAWGSTYDRDELIRRLRQLEPAYSFRSRYGYSNYLFLVAGQVIPQVTDQTWDEFVKDRLFDPLGMTRTTTSVRGLESMANVARPHTKADGKVVAISYVNLDNMGPAGSLNSSVADLAQWMRLQLADGAYDGQRIVEASVIRETRKLHTAIPFRGTQREYPRFKLFRGYGLGWGLSDYAGRLLVGHTGGIFGMLSRVAMIPEENLGVVVLTNSDEHRLYSAVAFRLLDGYLELLPFDWSGEMRARDEERRAKEVEAKKKRQAKRAEGTRPSRTLRHYCGLYRNKLYGDARISEQDGRLRIELAAHPDTPGVLEHWHYDTFLCRWRHPSFGESMVPFTLDETGGVSGFTVRVRPDWIDPLEYRFERVPPEVEPAQAAFELEDEIATVGCATCIFDMADVAGCVLAIQLDGKHYLVHGSNIDDHGDAHAADGLCNTRREAVVTGSVQDGVFQATHLVLLPE